MAKFIITALLVLSSSFAHAATQEQIAREVCERFVAKHSASMQEARQLYDLKTLDQAEKSIFSMPISIEIKNIYFGFAKMVYSKFDHSDSVEFVRRHTYIDCLTRNLQAKVTKDQ